MRDLSVEIVTSIRLKINVAIGSSAKLDQKRYEHKNVGDRVESATRGLQCFHLVSDTKAIHARPHNVTA